MAGPLGPGRDGCVSGPSRASGWDFGQASFRLSGSEISAFCLDFFFLLHQCSFEIDAVVFSLRSEFGRFGDLEIF